MCYIEHHPTDDSDTLCNTLYTSVAEVIVIRRTEPDSNSQEFPCPHQRVQYECTTLRSVGSHTWMLPSGVGLGFTGASSVGRVRNSSDDQFSATLTSKMEDEDLDSDDLFFTSILLIIDPVNGSELICSGTAASGTVFQGNTTVVLTLLARITYTYARARPSATAYYIYVCSPRLTSSRVLAALAGKCLLNPGQAQ